MEAGPPSSYIGIMSSSGVPPHSTPGGFLDRLGRLAMLVLAGLVTLSLIGAIAAIPSGSIETRMGLETPRIETPPLPETEPRTAEPRADRAAGASDGRSPAGAPIPPPPAPDAARWLEAITYALLALVGLTALASLLLWRSLRERRRIADALEEIAARR